MLREGVRFSSRSVWGEGAELDDAPSRITQIRIRMPIARERSPLAKALDSLSGVSGVWITSRQSSGLQSFQFLKPKN